MDADFFMPRPAWDMSGFMKKPAETADLTALYLRVLEALKVPVKVHEGDGWLWTHGRQELIGKELLPAWTGHSERATLASGLAALGVPKSDRDQIGRWSAEGSDTYVRSYRAVVKRLLVTFARAAGNVNGFVDLDEEDAILDLQKVFEKRISDKISGMECVDELIRLSKDFFKTQTSEVVDLMDHAAEGRAAEEFKEHAAAEVEDSEDEFAYIISVSKRGKKATLHKKEGCWRSKRFAFGSYETVEGQELPSDSLYDFKCKNCWAVKVDDDDLVEDLAGSSSSCSSSCSSSSVS